MKKRKRKRKEGRNKKKLTGKTEGGESNIYKKKKKDRNRPLNQTIPIQKSEKERREEKPEKPERKRKKERKKEKKFSY